MSDSEEAQTALRGGSYVGDSFFTSTATTWPLALLAISSISLRLTVSGIFRANYEFPRRAIQRLVFRRRRIFKILGLDVANVQIIHNLPEVPRYIVFRTLDADSVASALKSVGFEYSVAEKGISQGAPNVTKPFVIALGSVGAVLLGLLFKFRLLPFLKPDTILSGGKRVATAHFADAMSGMFFFAAALCLLASIAWVAIQLKRRSRKTKSGSTLKGQ